VIAFINASPLMYLGKLGLFVHLPKLYEPIITCSRVKEELLEDLSAPEHAAIDIAFSSWLSIKEPEDVAFINKLLELNIHPGETGVLALARESQDDNVLIIDDLAAREISRALGLKVIGTLGILLELVKNGIVSSEEAKGSLKYLVEKTTFRISTKLYSLVLEKFEEHKG